MSPFYQQFMALFAPKPQMPPGDGLLVQPGVFNNVPIPEPRSDPRPYNELPFEGRYMSRPPSGMQPAGMQAPMMTPQENEANRGAWVYPFEPWKDMAEYPFAQRGDPGRIERGGEPWDSPTMLRELLLKFFTQGRGQGA